MSTLMQRCTLAGGEVQCTDHPLVEAPTRARQVAQGGRPMCVQHHTSSDKWYRSW